MHGLFAKRFRGCSFKLLTVLVLLNWLCIEDGVSAENDRQERIKKAIQRAIPLVEKSAREYLLHRECFSCHHQAMPIIALARVRDNGFSINDATFRSQVKHTAQHFSRNLEKYRQGQGTGGQVDTAGYGLWALNVGGVSPNLSTEAVTAYLLKRNQKLDYWKRSSERPPSEASHFTSTYVAVRGLRAYGASNDREAIQKKLSQIKSWLTQQPVEETEDLVFRLKLAVELQFKASVRSRFAKEILNSQRADGGWAQLPNLQSDAYATSTVLDAILESKEVSISDDRIHNGVDYLLDRQKSDGSWFVHSRSSPFQEYFETGFPHLEDQFISITATCWAIMTLSRLVQPGN
ncbi:MAG: prenyltransferase/squalene oxidase repeat-containing protein [Planctomycetota bacterium]|nr:prenyltransferase/squalene oxidase repeat-containing protein [Planctomycetota bacterium]